MNKERIKNFVTNNGTAIVGSMLMAGVSFICIKYNIPIFGSTLTSSNSSDSFASRVREVYIPRNSVETAIGAVYDSAKSYTFGSDKVNAAKDIYKLLKKQEDLDDSTKSFAINLMNKLSKSCRFASDRESISKLILDL